MRSTFENTHDDYVFVSEIPVETLDQWIDHCATFTDECVLQISNEGYHTLAVDRAEIALVDTSLYKEACESHRVGVDGTGEISVGIDLERVQDLLNLMNKSDLVTLSFDNETRMIHIQGSGIKRSLGSIDPNHITTQQGMPDVPHTTVVELPTDEFKRAVKSSELVSGDFTIGYYDGESENRQNGVFFYAEADNDDSLYEPNEQQVHEWGDASTRLSTEYVKNVEKVARNADSVVLEFGRDLPFNIHLTVSESVEGDTREIIDTTYCIAPRVDSNL